MADASMRLEGASDLERKLKRLEAKVAKKIVRRAVRDGAKVIMAETKARCPVDTGRLKRSFAIRASKGKRSFFGVAVFPSVKKEPDLVSHSKDGTRQYYPAVVEYGTSRRAARPFMRPAFDATKYKAAQKTIDVMNREIQAEARKR